jgi:predicted ATPase
MYLKKLAIKNYGPINELNIELPFKEDKTPKPVILVGKNGTGKTILLSHIIDSFYEISGDIFDDIKKYEGYGTKFFKISGSRNLQIGKDKGFSILQYELNGNNIEYFDKVGKLTSKDFIDYIDDFNLSPNSDEGFEKKVNIANKKDLEEKLLKGAYFYQPAYRYEEPFWKNDDFKHNLQFVEDSRYAGELKKEIEIINSLDKNKDFLLNLVLDFTIKLDDNSNILWANINEVLQKIKKREDIRLAIGPRGRYRVSIVVQDKNSNEIKQLVPSIENLSLGELVLLDMFINIIRHSCMYKSQNLNEIEGIVVIDEVDVHLHSDLQYEILPQLIKLFPKVQFILTTHSPLFLLGMKELFGEDGFEIRNMPTGELISVERFSEFENAFNYLKETEKFEEEIKKKIDDINKPILYVEDEYTQIYKIAYLKLKDIDFNESNLESVFEEKSTFEVISAKGAGGVAGLLRTKSPELYKDKKIIGLFDFDKEGRENFHNLSKEKFWTKEPKKDDECEEKEFNETMHKLCYKKRDDCKNFYALLLPIPKRLYKYASLNWENFASYVEVENLLDKDFIDNNKNLFEEKDAPGDLKYYKLKKDKKNIFWKELIGAEKNIFNDFKSIFNFIEEKFKD